MSKICTVCGSEMSDESLFCTACGAPFTAAAAPAAEGYADSAAVPTAEPEATDTPTTSRTGAKKFNFKKLLNAAKKDPKLRMVTLAAAAVVAVVLIVVIISACSNPWAKGMDNYIDLTYKGKASAVVKAAPNEVWDYIEDEYGLSKEDAKKDNKDYAEDIADEAEDIYGENIKYKYKVVKQKKMTKKMLESLAEAMEDNYDIDTDIVKAGYVVELEYEITGKDAFNWSEGTFFFVRIGNSWYRVSESGTLLALSEIMSTDTFNKEVIESAR